MKGAFVCWLLLISWVQAQTLWLNWKAADFVPLTELPWKGLELHEVPKIVERIFREPNADIRYAVLGEYLRQVPMLHFAYAFDTAVLLEGAQVPDAVVSLMLRIWAERDPQQAWERTQELVRLVGFEDRWLTYDAWKGRPKIRVQDLAAIRASRYWLSRNALLTYPLGVEASKASEAERVRLMKAFADLWFEKFKSWPGTPAERFAKGGEVLKMFQAYSYEGMRRGDVNSHGIMLPEAFEVGLRRWIVERPQEGAAIVKCIRHQHWNADAMRSIAAHDASISAEFLQTWFQASPGTLEAWADSEEMKESKEAWLAKCIMISKVDKARRAEWLSGIQPEDLSSHLAVLAPWNPELAMELAVRAQDGDSIEEVATAAVYGFGSRNWNRTHAVLEEGMAWQGKPAALF
ncbi:hypothetical protein [Prosthecobacter sp.]|uniref:hypothetical protein n=1 Tax=Prosthecobacter sp. TaxID=1965333 RepID=UPI00378362F1